jgi:hypothetical protein
MGKYLHLFTSKHPELHKALEHVKMGGEEAGHVSHSMALAQSGDEAQDTPTSHNKGTASGISKPEEGKTKAHIGDHDSDDNDDAYQRLLNKHKKSKGAC